MLVLSRLYQLYQHIKTVYKAALRIKALFHLQEDFQHCDTWHFLSYFDPLSQV